MRNKNKVIIFITENRLNVEIVLQSERLKIHVVEYYNCLGTCFKYTFLTDILQMPGNSYRIETGKNICVNVTCLGSCNVLLSKAT